ncbi:hypothetical protein OG453_36155 [Streptomyces sp. NBC_01381]|uniref:hypothetical protein n=1 Tax=Streptomyces sp. NBC_01381 TaxID=2903845 RepID=UPI002259B03B|nr:hypothetical protein [Streptomyces sp. NBC_01381]MCX4672051.1 hypothetical protein [Streptomyces sp. NBC_01381]
MNLVVNGDAESGSGGTADPVATVRGWKVAQGAPALIAYSLGGGYPTASDPGPARRGSRFFSGGNSPRTVLVQDIDLPRSGPTGRRAVDAGKVRYTLAAGSGGLPGRRTARVSPWSSATPRAPRSPSACSVP